MRFLLILVLAVLAVYAALSFSLYGSVDPCVGLSREVALQTVREAQQAALDRGEPGLLPRDRERLESRTRGSVTDAIRGRDLSPLDCFKGLVAAKSRGKDSPEVQALTSRPR